MSEGIQKRSNIVLAVLVGIAVAILIGFVSIRNAFVTGEEAINASWAQVENQLQRRSDLIPNLVNTVKGYAKHETTIFTNIAAARAQLAGAKNPQEKIAASQKMESALARLLVVVENYPNLKADQQFSRLMDELAGTENRISVERKKYNENVQAYNLSLRRFPSNIVAGFLNYTKKPYFQVAEQAKDTPKIEF
jgi:LemA protein